MGVYSVPERPSLAKDPELAALQEELNRLYRLEHKEEIKAEVQRLRAKFGKEAEPTIDEHMKVFWESKGIKVTNVRGGRG